MSGCACGLFCTVFAPHTWQKTPPGVNCVPQLLQKLAILSSLRSYQRDDRLDSVRSCIGSRAVFLAVVIVKVIQCQFARTGAAERAVRPRPVEHRIGSGIVVSVSFFARGNIKPVDDCLCDYLTASYSDIGETLRGMIRSFVSRSSSKYAFQPPFTASKSVSSNAVEVRTLQCAPLSLLHLKP